MAGKRILREIKTVTRMVELYEQRHPAPADTPEHYRDLLAYAVKRLEKCRYGEDKPACKQCPVHCYQPKPREEMKVIMRWAGRVCCGIIRSWLSVTLLMTKSRYRLCRSAAARPAIIRTDARGIPPV